MDPVKNQTAIARTRRRIIGTLAPAAAGCLAGYYYGQWFGDPEYAARIGLPGMYATVGAVLGILGVRLGSLLWMIVRDFLGRD